MEQVKIEVRTREKFKELVREIFIPSCVKAGTVKLFSVPEVLYTWNCFYVNNNEENIEVNLVE